MRKVKVLKSAVLGMAAVLGWLVGTHVLPQSPLAVALYSQVTGARVDVLPPPPPAETTYEQVDRTHKSDSLISLAAQAREELDDGTPVAEAEFHQGADFAERFAAVSGK